MSRIIKKGATDQTIYFEVLDSSSATGGRLTGLVFNSASLTGYYVRNGGSATAITLATLAAANSAHSDGGFKEVDATNMPGVYRLDLPDAAVASGAESVVVTIKGATNMVQVSSEIQLKDYTDEADALLNRDLSTGTDSGSSTVRTVRQALRFLRNKWAIAAGTLTVYKEDDATSSWTAAVTTTAGDPVSASDPAGP